MSHPAQSITSAVVKSVRSAVAKCASGGAGSKGANACKQAGQWSYETTQIVDASIQNIACSDIKIGVTHAVQHDVCCVGGVIAQVLVDAVRKVQVSQADKESFWKELLGAPPPKQVTVQELTALVTQHMSSSCGQGAASMQMASVQDIFFSCDSSTTCDDLSFAINNSSSSITCFISQVASAQTKVWSSSKTERGNKPSISSTLVTTLIILACIVGVCVVVTLGVKWLGRRQFRTSRRLRLSDI